MIDIIEVGPRDGLQNEAVQVATATKIELINRLAATGLRTVEATSFVNPKAVPQMADAAEVLQGIDRTHAVAHPVLVPNMRGYDAARAAGATQVAVFTAASNTFNERNVGASIDESFERIAPIVARAAADGVAVRGYVSCAFGCPFEGVIAPAAVLDVTTRLAQLGIDDISIGDTIGVAVPREIAPVMQPLQALGSIRRLALHLHDTRGTGLANVMAGLEIGIDTFDASVAGLGGCPFAPGATGNLATEDLVWLLEREGHDTGVDLEALIATAQWVAETIDRRIAGHIARSTVWNPA